MKEIPELDPQSYPYRYYWVWKNDYYWLYLYLSLTARSSIRMTAIQMNAVRKSNSKMVVRGSTRA
jgi:hypothetical protein